MAAAGQFARYGGGGLADFCGAGVWMLLLIAVETVVFASLSRVCGHLQAGI